MPLLPVLTNGNEKIRIDVGTYSRHNSLTWIPRKESFSWAVMPRRALRRKISSGQSVSSREVKEEQERGRFFDSESVFVRAVEESDLQDNCERILRFH